MVMFTFRYMLNFTQIICHILSKNLKNQGHFLVLQTMEKYQLNLYNFEDQVVKSDHYGGIKMQSDSKLW